MLSFPKRPQELWLCSDPFCINSSCNKQHFIFTKGIRIKYLTKKEIEDGDSDDKSQYSFIGKGKIHLDDYVNIKLVKNNRKYGLSKTYKKYYMFLYFAEIAKTFLLTMNRIKLNFEKNILIYILNILFNQYYEDDKFLEYLQDKKYYLPSFCSYNYKCEDINCKKLHFSIYSGIDVNYNQNKILPRNSSNYCKEIRKYYKATLNINNSLELRLHKTNSIDCKIRWIQTYNEKIITTLLLCIKKKYNLFLNRDLILKIFLFAFREHIHLLHRNCRYNCNKKDCKFSHKCPKCGLYIVNYFNHYCK